MDEALNKRVNIGVLSDVNLYRRR